MSIGPAWSRRALGASSAQAVRSLLILPAGQSNATRRAPRATTTYPSKLKQFTGAGEPTDRADGRPVQIALPGSYFSGLVAYSERGDDEEGMAPGIAESMGGPFAEILTLTVAVGGRHYRELRYGQGMFQNLEQALHSGLEALPGVSEVLLYWDQGEQDADASPPGGGGSEAGASVAEYLDVMADLVRSWRMVYRRQASSLTVPDIWTTQIAHVGGDGWRNVQNAQLLAALTLDGVQLVGPKYAYAHEGDGVHITGTGKRLYAEYVGHRATEGGLPPYIASASRSGAVITLTYGGLVGDVTIDTTAVPATDTAFADSLHGFEAFDGATALGIASVVASGNTVTVTLDADPGGAVTLRYAQQTWPGGTQIVAGINSKLARGNVRDTGGSHVAALDGSTLYRWAAHQSMEVA